MSALSEFATGAMRGRAQRRRFRRRFAYLNEAKAVVCGFCTEPLAGDRPDNRAVASTLCLQVVLARRSDDRDGMAEAAVRVRRLLRARRSRPAGSLCTYCYMRFAQGRVAAEMLGRGGKWGAKA